MQLSVKCLKTSFLDFSIKHERCQQSLNKLQRIETVNLLIYDVHFGMCQHILRHDKQLCGFGSDKVQQIILSC